MKREIPFRTEVKTSEDYGFSYPVLLLPEEKLLAAPFGPGSYHTISLIGGDSFRTDVLAALTVVVEENDLHDEVRATLSRGTARKEAGDIIDERKDYYDEI
jgi:hypothetical protein